MAHVLFVCLHNAGRSQISQALFERAAAGRHTAASAGTTPAERLHPEVIEVMRELGIDLTGRTPQRLTHELAERADVVVTMGCGDQCPYIPGRRYLDWELPDPKGRPIDEVRATRDEISRSVRALVDELDRADGDAAVAELPVACTLGPDDGAARLRRWQALAEKGSPSARRSGPLLEVRYQDEPGVREELEALAAAERECCSFLVWDVGQDGRHPVLRVTADPSAPDDVAPIAALFRAG